MDQETYMATGLIVYELVQDFFTFDQTNQSDNKCNHKKDMNKASHCIRSHDTEQPQHDKNNNDGPKHRDGKYE